MKVEEIKRNQHLLKRKIKEKVKDKICYKTTEVKSKTLDWGLVLSLAIYKGGQNGHVRNSLSSLKIKRFCYLYRIKKKKKMREGKSRNKPLWGWAGESKNIRKG